MFQINEMEKFACEMRLLGGKVFAVTFIRVNKLASFSSHLPVEKAVVVNLLMGN